MSSNLESVKETLVFLGKSLFTLLEALLFQVIPKPQKNVAGEIVLITGAGSGLGRLLALQFARLGSVLVLWDVNKEANEETLRIAQEAGATRAHAYTCDCSQKEEVYRVADQVYLGVSLLFVGCENPMGLRWHASVLLIGLSVLVTSNCLQYPPTLKII